MGVLQMASDHLDPALLTTSPAEGMSRGKSGQNLRALARVALYPPCLCGAFSQPSYPHPPTGLYEKNFHSRIHTRCMHL